MSELLSSHVVPRPIPVVDRDVWHQVIFWALIYQIESNIIFTESDSSIEANKMLGVEFGRPNHKDFQNSEIDEIPSRKGNILH